MTELEMITQFINNSGFPIAACVGMFVLYYKTVMPLQKSVEKLVDVVTELKEGFKK